MFSLKDWVLLAVVFLSIAGGAFFPKFGSIFQPYPVYGMMGIIFLSFMPIRVADLWKSLRKSGILAVTLLVHKSIVFPAGMYLLFRLIVPEYAPSALLLSGISTGVSAPFFAHMLGGSTSLVLAMVVGSSMLVPFTLPGLVQALMGQSTDMPLFAMIRLLGTMIFIPMLLVEATARFAPRLLAKISSVQFAIALPLFAATNLGVFSKYSEFLNQQASTLILALVVSIAVAAMCFIGGILFSWKQPLTDQVSAVLSFGYMNTILAMIFGSEFFTPLEPTTAGVYHVPLFGFIVALRYYQGLRAKYSVA